MRARLTARPEQMPRLQAFVETEQDVNDSARRALTVGGNYALTEKTRLYAQHALVSSLSELSTLNGQNLRNATVVGVDSAYMEGGRLYNEYRALSTAAPQNATGLRNTFKLNDEWRLSGGIEHIQTLGANPVSSASNTTATATSATAFSLGAEWARNPWRASGAFERRNATSSSAGLYNLAAAWRLNDDLTLLGRIINTDVEDHSNGSSNGQERQQIGLAWRPAYADKWNVLSRYEHRRQHVTPGNGASTDPFSSGGVFGGYTPVAGITESHIVSTHANLKVDRSSQMSMRWAGKWSTQSDTLGSSSYWLHLLHSRYTRDLNKKWDVSMQGGYMFGQGGTTQKTAGLEVGYQAVPSLWISAGYNVLGLKEPDLTGQDYTSKGMYLRLRWKFDEATLQFGRVAAPATAQDKTQ